MFLDHIKLYIVYSIIHNAKIVDNIINNSYKYNILLLQ